MVVEMEDSLSGPVPAATPGEIVERLDENFETIARGIKPIARTIMSTLTDIGPEAVAVEFGIKFSAKAGVVVASATTEGHCKVTLSWTKPPTG